MRILARENKGKGRPGVVVNNRTVGGACERQFAAPQPALPRPNPVKVLFSDRYEAKDEKCCAKLSAVV